MNQFGNLPSYSQSRKNKFWIALSAGVGLATAAAFGSSLDPQFRDLLQADSLPGDCQRFLKLMEIFAHGTGFAITLALIWTLAPEFRSRLPRLITTYVLTGAIVNLIKLVVPRIRPLAEDGLTTAVGTLNLQHATQSFPSGHSAAALSLAISLGVLFPKGRYLFLVLAVFACLQRITFEAHWMSDVLAGAAIGIWIAALLFLTTPGDRLFASIETPSAPTSSS